MIKQKNGNRRLLFCALGAIALIALWGIKYRFFTEKQQQVMVVAVTRGDVEETVLATGTLKPITLVAVGAQVSGRVISLKVKLGQKVKQGDLIAEIDSIKQTNDLRTAEASLAMARAQKMEKESSLAKAQSDLEREKVTYARNASSKASLDAATQIVKAAQAQLDYIEAQIEESQVAVETARVNLGYTRITAPTDGTVLSIVVQEGQTVNSVQSAPTIVILGDIDTMTVRAEISEADIVNVKPGQEVYFTILGDRTRRYRATLDSIEPAPESIKSDSAVVSTVSSSSSSSVSQSAVYYIGVFNVPNTDGSLRTYMTAQITIVLGKAQNTLILPASALETPEKDGSYRLDVQNKDQSITSRKVTIGLNNKVMAQVLSGLEEGDLVVTGREAVAGSSNASGGRRQRIPRMGM